MGARGVLLARARYNSFRMEKPNPVLLEQLLNEEESTTLDFKRDQYPFVNAPDEQKSELLKDILAFANAWRRSDAFILVGVNELKGGRSIPVGVTEHLDDAQLQQFVNSKVQRPLAFSYHRVEIDGYPVGVFQIPLQSRPFFLTKDYGRLKRDVVYIRRGSSTDVVALDEVLKMQAANQITTAVLDIVVRKNGVEARDLIIGISNAAGSAPASAPYLEFEIPEPYAIAQYGMDGWGTDGLPRIPQSGRDVAVPKFRGDTNTVIHPGVTLDVTRIKCKPPTPLPSSISVKFKIAAANCELREGVATLEL